MELKVAFVEGSQIVAFDRRTHVRECLFQLFETDFLLRYDASRIALEDGPQLITVSYIGITELSNLGRTARSFLNKPFRGKNIECLPYRGLRYFQKLGPLHFHNLFAGR